MVNPSSHRTPNDISGDLLLASKMLILLAASDITVSGNVSTCVYVIVIPLDSLSVVVCLHIFGTILFDAVFAKFILAPESDISMLVLKGTTLDGELIV